MLDTNTCIFLIREDPRIIPHESAVDCCISTIVAGELEYGYRNSDRRPENRARLDVLLRHVAIVEVNVDVAVQWGDLKVAMKRAMIGPNDLWIAAHALALNLPLVTNNTREFARVPGLIIDDWLEDDSAC